jgi:hypothetical protein
MAPSPSDVGTSGYRPRYINPASQTDLTLQILRSATALLAVLTPTQATPSISLVFYLGRRLLADHFPASAAPASHKKLLLLIVVRFYSFMRLSKILSTLSTSATLCTGASIEHRDTSELFLPLHNRIYSAVVEAAGLAQSDTKMSEDVLEQVEVARRPEALQEIKSLRQAARRFLACWSEPVALRRDEEVERPFLVSKHVLAELFDLGPPIAFSSSSPTFPTSAIFSAVHLSSSPSSFKRGRDSSPNLAVPEHHEPGLLSQVALALSQIKELHKSSSGSKEDWALFYASSAPSSADLVQVSQEPGVGRVRQVPQVLPNPTPATEARKEGRSSPFGWRSSSKSRPEEFDETESVLIQQAVQLLCESQTELVGEDLLSILQRAAADAVVAQHFPAGVLYGKAAQLISSITTTRPHLATTGLAVLLDPILAPLEQAACDRKASQHALESLSLRLSGMVDNAMRDTHRTIDRVDALRCRCWFSALKHSPEFTSLVNRLSSSSRRTPQQRAEALRAAQRHNVSAGVQMFFEASLEDRPTCDFVETLVAVDQMASRSMSLEKVLASPFWKCEALVINDKVQRESPSDNGFVEGSMKAANFLISAPGLLLTPLVCTVEGTFSVLTSMTVG